MGNKCKRYLALLIMAVLLVAAFGMQAWANQAAAPAAEDPGCYTYGDVNGDGLVDQNDAIHLLYYSMDTPGYSLNGRGGEMDGEEGITADDAIHLLFHTFPSFAEKYALPVEGKVHSYSETWNWRERETVTGKVMHATMTLKCAGCGHEVIAFDSDVAPVAGESLAATCTAAGKNVYKAEVDGYESSYVKLLPATGHSVQPVCTGSQVCEFCQGTIAAKDHTWGDAVRVEPDCDTTGSITYTCTADGCGATKGQTIPALGHSYGAEVEMPVAGVSCQYAKVKTCGTCGDEVRSEVYSKHSFTVLASFEAATCSAEGHKVYACDICGETREETVALDAAVHTWDGGVSVDGGKLYTCSGCHETKTVVEIKAEDVVTSADIQDKELTLDEQGTSIALSSDASNGLDSEKNIQISVERVEDSDFSENTVYDFTMNYVDDQGNTEAITDFQGDVVVTLPYTLSEGEDVECILVRYIPVDENGNPGEPVHIQATYANGYITFTTNHFSYYTVTRLTPAERCELYGHKYGTVPMVVAPTCTEDGYTQEICQRCRYIDKHDIVAAFGHQMVEAADHTGTADCENAGIYHMVCANEGCGSEVFYEIPALGHEYLYVEAESVEADCTKAGKQVYACANEGCGSAYEIDLPQLDHDFQEFEGGVAAPTCTEKGYVQHRCTVCKEVTTVEEIPALGHDLTVGEPTWTWTDGYPEVTVQFVCANDASHTWTVDAVITEEDHTNCEGGYITYVARGEYKGETFAFTENVPQEGEGHKFDQDGDGQADWLTDNAKHYHQCTVCKGIYDSAAHGWGTGTVTKEATCTEKGEMVYKCACGREKKEVLSATGIHDVKNGVCVDCGFVTNECKHYINWNNPIIVTLDLESIGGCEGTVEFVTCECGQEKRIMGYDSACVFGEEREEIRYSELCDREYTVNIAECTVCGLTQEYYNYDGFSYDPCAWLECSGNKWYIGDEVIFDYYNEWIIEEHPTHADGTVMEIVELSDFGLCGGTYYKVYCPCGEHAGQEVEEGCSWEWNEELSAGGTDGTKEYNVYDCTVCGARRIVDATYSFNPANCHRDISIKYSYHLGGVEKFAYTESWLFVEHNWDLDSYKLLGDSCYDGIELTLKCAICGAFEESYWMEGHCYGNGTELDLSGYDICYDTLIKQTCLCGEQLREEYLGGYMVCDWYRDPELSTSEKTVYICRECGAKRVQTTTIGTPDEYCNVLETVVNTLYDADGNYIVTYYRDYDSTVHDYEESFVLAEGSESCEDGVVISRTCKNCGYHYESTYYYHAGMEVKTLDVSGLNMCGDTVTLMTCACGENSWLDMDCGGWRHVEGGSGYDITQCVNCGVCRKTESEIVEVVDACHDLRRYTVTFFNDNGEKSISYSRKEASHNAVWVMELLPGATDCTGGYTLKRVCQDCDYEETYQNQYYHDVRVVERTLIATKDQLCGDFYREYSRCACGLYEESSYCWENGYCEWDNVYNEELGYYENICRNCGVRQYRAKRTAEKPEDSCYLQFTNHMVYEKDGKVILTTMDKWQENCHNWEYTFTFSGEGTENCENGYTYTAVCPDCGETRNNDYVQYGHHGHLRRTQLIHGGEGICGAIYIQEYACGCGMESYYNIFSDCHWKHLGMTGDGVEVYECSKCGVQRHITHQQSDVDDNCDVLHTYTEYLFLNDECVATYSYTHTQKEHNYAASYELFGKTCEDGYKCVKTCKRCGDSYEFVYEAGVPSCGWVEGLGKTVIGADADICSPIEIEPYSCACGSNTGFWWDYNCSFEDVWDEEGYWIGVVCSECGLQRTTERTETKPDENCDKIYTEILRFILDGEELGTLTIDGRQKEHNYGATFELYGETCEDGFKLTEICQRCGDSRESYYEPGEQRCDWGGWGLGEVLVHDGTGICGPISVEKCSCACGENQWVNWSYDCRFDHNYGAYGENAYGCEVCGLVRVDEYSYTEIDPETCIRTETRTCTFLLDGEEVASHTSELDDRVHNMMYQATLVPGGTSCEDGYTLSEVCSRCGKTESYSDIRYDHDTRCTERYELQDYGMCGGYVNVDSCACGKNQNVYMYQDCDYSYTGEIDPITGAEERFCRDCGTYTYYQYETETDRENCRTEGKFHFSAKRDGETLLKLNRDVHWTEHTYVMKDYQLMDGAVDCEGGWTGRNECVYCGDGYETEGSYHSVECVRYVDLDAIDGICGGYLKQRQCACGRDTNYEYHLLCNLNWVESFTELGADGYEHHYSRYRCDTCGLERLEDDYTVKEEGSCDTVEYQCRTFTFGDVLKETLVNKYYSESHNYGEAVCTLDEGAASCDEGVIITQTCKDCGHVSTSWSTGHSWQNKVESIDLAQYGSICGQTLDHWVCPCGQNDEWKLAEGDFCDVDWNGTDLDWVRELIAANNMGERMVDEWHGVTGNAYYSYSNAYILTCAVTDPEPCGLKIRYADYWVKNGCEIQRYQTWQLGFDPETGECQYDFTFATGEKRPHHDHEGSYEDTVLDDGTRYTVEMDTCVDCGSYRKWKHYYRNDEVVKSVSEHVNTLNDGDLKRYYEVYEYGFEQQYEQYGETRIIYRETLHYYETTQADGSVYWSRDEYTYADGNGCHCTRVHSDSNGNNWSEESTNHNSYWDYEDLLDPTCTQPGLRHEWNCCIYCGEITWEQTGAIDPNDHCWCRDYEKQTYVCCTCGLENINGASGSVVMEDLTARYGNDENYVIGYWNRENVRFSQYVSVVFEDRGDDHPDGREFVLDVEIFDCTKEYDGFVGKSFSKADAIAAAQAAMAEQGYEGTFAIRISFVPENGQTTLDYAITFDPINAA